MEEVKEVILFEKVEVGMFKLPGLRFEKGQIPEDLHNDMVAWSKENHCGTAMNEWLWSFKSEEKRDRFILRWSDSIPKPKDEDA